MRIHLNGRMNADLDWKKEKEKALQTEEDLIWELDLGLFSNLKYPLAHKSQHLSLRLSLEHFQADIWSAFQLRTQAVVLYRGPLDFSRELQNDDKLGCSEMGADYLDLLVDGFAEMPFCLELDAGGIEDRWLEALLRNRARFPRFKLHVAHSQLLLDDNARVAVMLPPAGSVGLDRHRKLAQSLRELKQPFRIIPEEFFLLEWSELDYVIVDSATVDLQQKRKLQGFAAAGGVIITLGERLGLSGERDAIII